MGVSRMQNMLNFGHAKLSIVRLCILLKASRSSLYYERTEEAAMNLTLHRIFSTRIRAASLPCLPLQAPCGTMEINISMDAGALAGQRVYRTPLALAQIRKRVPERLRNRLGSPRGHRQMDQLLQTHPHNSLDGATPERCYQQGLLTA